MERLLDLLYEQAYATLGGAINETKLFNIEESAKTTIEFILTSTQKTDEASL